VGKVPSITEPTDDYPWGVGRNATERAFLRRLAERFRTDGQRGLFDAWTFFPHLVVTLSIDDSLKRLVVRTLRVDYHEDYLAGGNDLTHQISESDLDREDPDFFEVVGPQSPEEAADLAYRWFRQEARRPIDRHESHRRGRGGIRWVLADVDRDLVGKYPDRLSKPPDRVTRLEPPWP
jgi:hypothetical protein